MSSLFSGIGRDLGAALTSLGSRISPPAQQDQPRAERTAEPTETRSEREIPLPPSTPQRGLILQEINTPAGASGVVITDPSTGEQFFQQGEDFLKVLGESETGTNFRKASEEERARLSKAGAERGTFNVSAGSNISNALIQQQQDPALRQSAQSRDAGFLEGTGLGTVSGFDAVQDIQAADQGQLQATLERIQAELRRRSGR